jgi:cystathionine beta-lyase
VGAHSLSFNFDQEINREQSNSVKYDGRQGYFGTSDVIPLWVADMDFASPDVVTQALVERAQHPIYGYTLYPDSLFEALTTWMQTRHNWAIEREWIVMSSGVVPSLYAAVLAFSAEGEGVIIQPPVYHPFFSAATTNGRRLIENPLVLTNGRYSIDFEHLEQSAADGAKLLLLCSPHNPVGRVWTKEEQLEILRIARQYNLVVLSDEIHADLVYSDYQHISLATLAQTDDRIITAVAPSKTFNIPGLGLSSLIIPNSADRNAMQRVFNSLHLSASNPFSITAFEAAYRLGGDWKDALMSYLKETHDTAIAYIHEHLQGITALKAEGTYLLWLDCRALGMTDAQLTDFFLYKAKVGMSAGTVFGAEGSGFMRMNLGAPRTTIMKALEQIKLAQEI